MIIKIPNDLEIMSVLSFALRFLPMQRGCMFLVTRRDSKEPRLLTKLATFQKLNHSPGCCRPNQ